MIVELSNKQANAVIDEFIEVQPTKKVVAVARRIIRMLGSEGYHAELDELNKLISIQRGKMGENEWDDADGWHY